jgi:hypothetical protein
MTTNPAPRKPEQLGTGLPTGPLAAVLLVSLAVFAIYDGPLWSAPPDASHVGRIVVSYLVVLPLLALALAWKRRLTLTTCLTATALVWSVKLLVTSSVYFLLAPGSARDYAPARPWERAAATPSAASEAPPGSGTISGSVHVGGAPAAGSVVYVEGPTDAIGGTAEVVLTLAGGAYDRRVYRAVPGDRLVARNADSVLHTVRITHDGSSIANLPLPAGGAPRPLPPPEPGAYTLGCAAHSGETAALVVADGARTALSGADGKYALQSVPAGERVIVAVADAEHVARRSVVVAAGAEAVIDFTIPNEEGP